MTKQKTFSEPLPDTSKAIRQELADLAKLILPPPEIGVTEWAETYRFMSAKSAALPGKYSAAITPWVRGMHEALDDPGVYKVVARKSAQVGWTDGVLLNFLGKRICIDPAPMIVMFAREQSAKEFSSEKFGPMVEVTPELLQRIPLKDRRSADNRWNFKGFPGGFLKLVGSNSPSSVKSTPAPVVCVEEPDDCNDNVAEQGDTITLLEERTKTYAHRKVVFGGTPTIAGLSRVDESYKGSDQRHFFVPCPECGEWQDLKWENVKWDTDDSRRDEILGNAVPETARYVCPHCGCEWTDEMKNRAVRKGVWKATAPFHGVAGFAINEIYSPFPGSRMEQLVRKYLTAQHAMELGDDTKMRSFVNNQLGEPYSYVSELPQADDLMERAEEYEEFTVPSGGLVVTAGVDVQHDRVAVVIRAWGRGEESWLLYWGELPGQVAVPEKGVWPDLDALLSRKFKSADGFELPVKAVSIDSSDGQTSDAVYSFVRKRQAQGYMAIKGSSTLGKEIFNIPKASIDMGKHRKSAKYGLRPYIVGVDRAKDLWLGVDAEGGRIRLLGQGPGRVHWYKTVRPDYWEQILSEIKVPHRTIKGKMIWQKKAGIRNEALDCEVYALHAARSLRLNLKKKDWWDAYENRLKGIKPEPKAAVEEPEVPKPKERPKFRPSFGGFSATSW